MAALRYAQVRLRDRPAGTLREVPGGGFVFEYADGAAEDIACALPASVRVHETSRGLHPFFQHLTPEGWLRGRQARRGEVDAADDFGLLLRYGADCIGAVSINDPEGKPLGTAAGDDAEDTAIAQPRTLSGVQPKILAVKTGQGFRPAGPAGPAPYIAKFAADDLPDIVTNEHLTLTCCRRLLGADAVTESERAVVEGIARPALLVKRFDRTLEGARLRLEDFAQVLSRPRGRDFQGKYDGDFEACGALIREHSARPEIDLLRFFERIVAFYLLGNGDCHLKNFSLLETPEGFRLSPAYDVVNTYIYAAKGYTTRFGLRIGGEVRQHDAIDRALLETLGANIGLRPSAVKQTFRRLKPKAEDALKKLPSPADRADDLFGPFADSVRTFAARLFDTD